MISFPAYKVEQFFHTYTIQHFTVSEDESRLLFSTNLNGRMNIWARDLPDGFPYLFAETSNSSQFIKEDKNQEYILTALDKDGNENYQMQILPPEGGLPSALFQAGTKEKHIFQELRDDGNVYFATSRGNSSFLNGFRFNIHTGESKKLYEGSRGATFMTAVSPNGRKVIVSELRANTHMPGYCIDDEGNWQSLSSDPEIPHTIGAAAFKSDTKLYLVSNEEAEYSYIAEMNLESGKKQKVLDFNSESVESIKWIEETGFLYVLTSRGVEDHMYSFDPQTGSLQSLEAPASEISQFSVSKSGNVYILGMGADEPFNIHRLKDGSWERLTENRVPGVPKEEMICPEVISYETFDGKMIEALWFQPDSNKTNGHVIFWPHGGPQAAERKQFRAMFQSFLNEGYAVFAPNFRGSTGYGSSFTKLVEQDWGEGPRLDCLAGIDWLFETGRCDPEKLFLVGGSYGGYMALLLAGRHGERFRAVVDIFGVSNLFTFIKSVPDHWRPIMERWLGDPEKDKERLKKDSPITYLSSMRKPMLVIQGANDPRVVKKESDQIVEALQKQGTEVEYLVLEDEGHGFSKKENEVTVYKTMLRFLESHQSKV
jgi:dipeptidyl aminopeptidase/acylaminoacyl peptidase